MEIYNLIKSLHEEGKGYRSIAKYLNKEGILTEKKNRWGDTGNTVHSVLKRYREREERLRLREKDYPTVRSKMVLEYDKR